MSPTNRTRSTLNLTFIGLLMVSISQLAIAESHDNEKENLTFTLNQLPRPDHVVIVIEENKSYKQIIGNIEAPFINQLANEGALFTNSFAITHPSQPNYLVLFLKKSHPYLKKEDVKTVIFSQVHLKIFTNWNHPPVLPIISPDYM